MHQPADQHHPIEYLKSLGIRTLKFDAQGYIQYWHNAQLYRVHPLAIREGANAAPNQYFQQLVAQFATADPKNPDYIAALTHLFTTQNGAITNLGHEIEFQILGVTRAYGLCINEANKQQQITQEAQRLIHLYTSLIVIEFPTLLKKHFSGNAIDVAALNRELDTRRAHYQQRFLTEFAKFLKKQGLPILNEETFHHTLKSTVAVPDFKMTQINADQTTQTIAASNTSAHDDDPTKIAPVTYGIQTEAQQFRFIRTPLLVPKYHSFFNFLESKASQNKRINTTFQKIEQSVEALALPPDDDHSPVFYHLLTSYFPWYQLYKDLNNQQVSRARLLMRAQDDYNHSEDHPHKLYTFHIPVNMHGSSIRGGQKKRDKILLPTVVTDIAWRNNMALIMMLGDEQKKPEIEALYRAYLADPAQKPALVQAINTTQLTLIDPADTNIKRYKNLLITLFNNKWHESEGHQLAKLVQALSIVVNADHALLGCKSGNERTAFILHRVDELLLGKLVIPTGPNINLEQIKAFNTALDEAISQKHTSGFSSYISFNDQHAAPKIAAASNFFSKFNTNAAESSTIKTLHNKGAKSLQAHNNSLALKTLSRPPLEQVSLYWLYGISIVSLETFSTLAALAMLHIVNPLALSLTAIALPKIIIGVIGFSLLNICCSYILCKKILPHALRMPYQPPKKPDAPENVAPLLHNAQTPQV